MNKNKGFTLVEVIGVIVIISLILILIVPQITSSASKSKISLKDSKINIIQTAATKYGNDLINDYQNCINLTSSELAAKCTVSIDELIKNGYIRSEDKNTSQIVDPITNKKMSGKALLCYDPVNVNIYATYVDDEHYSCESMDIATNHSFSIIPQKGEGYIGGKNLEVNILTSGTFEGGFSCKSSETNYATCEINSNKMTIKISDDKALEFDDTNSKYITFTIEGKYRDESGIMKALPVKEYFLKIYKTSLSIPASGEFCMQPNSLEEIELDAANLGDVEITSTDEKILTGSIKNNRLTLLSGNKTGNATLTITESNGGNRDNIIRNVYNFDVDIPAAEERRIGLYSSKTVNFLHRSSGKVTITSSNPDVLKVSSNTNSEAGSIVITNDEEQEFSIVGKNTGVAKITISPETCGNPVEIEYSVINMSLQEATMITYAGSTEILINNINVENPEGLKCSSSNTDAATCQIENTILKIIPGKIPANDVTITVESTKNGRATMKLNVLETSVRIENSDGGNIDYICTEAGVGGDSVTPYIYGTNMGSVSVESNEFMLKANIDYLSENDKTKIVVNNQFISGTVPPPYVEGFNTGKTSVKVTENRGWKSASVDYNIYDLKLMEENNKLEESIYETSYATELMVGKSKTLDVSFSTTGNISVSSSDESIVSVRLNDGDVYQDGINVYNNRTLLIQGLKEGNAVITIKGSMCGEKKYRVRVNKRNFYINFKNGTYSQPFDDRIECSTEGSNTSCEVTVPNFASLEVFNKVGFSKTKDSRMAEYLPGDKIIVNEENTGTVYYGNSEEFEKPICKFLDVPKYVATGSTVEMEMQCLDRESGLLNRYNLSDKDFELSNDNASIEISDPIDIEYGYSYKIYIIAKKNGLFKFRFKDEIIKDKFDNYNEGITFSNILISEYQPLALFEIGRGDIFKTAIDPETGEVIEIVETTTTSNDDIIAELVDNKTYKNIDNNTYSVLLYGTGETKNFASDEYSAYSPWYFNISLGEEEININNFITDVVINEGITSVGDNLFFQTGSIKNISLPSTLNKIGNRAFFNHDCENIYIPANVSIIGIGAFENDFNLAALIETEEFDLNNFKSKKVNPVFEGNSLLTEIKDSAFKDLNIESMSLPATLEIIGDYAFSTEKTKNVDLNIPKDSKLKTIGNYAFNGMILNSLTLPSTVISIGDYALFINDIEKFTFSESFESFGIAAITGNGIKEFEVDENNPLFITIDGILYDKEVTKLVKCPDFYNTDHSTIDVPSTVLSLEPGSFIATINYENNSGLEINIPSTVSNINAWQNFQGFTFSKINYESENYSSVNGILYDKAKTTLVKIPTAYIENSFNIPNTVTSIEEYAGYMNIMIKNITIPKSVDYISNYAFMTDSKYAYSTVNLLTENEIDLAYGVFDIISFNNEDPTSRIINVKTNILKNKIEDLYKANNPNLVVKVIT